MQYHNRFFGGLLFVALFIFLMGCSSTRAQPNTDDGAFEGTVSQVWEDGMILEIEGRNPLLIDTWNACGDNTSRFISVNDRVRVYASRDMISYDSWRILDEDGQLICDQSADSTDSDDSDVQTAVQRTRRNAEDGAIEGTVNRVWRDGMTLDTDNGQTIRIDTWLACGDNTSRTISSGDRVRVYANRDFLSYEAWRVLDQDGQPACSRSPIR